MKTTYKGKVVEGTVEEIKQLLSGNEISVGKKRKYTKKNKGFWNGKKDDKRTLGHSKKTRKQMSKSMKKSWKKRKKKQRNYY